MQCNVISNVCTIVYILKSKVSTPFYTISVHATYPTLSVAAPNAPTEHRPKSLRGFVGITLPKLVNSPCSAPKRQPPQPGSWILSF